MTEKKKRIQRLEDALGARQLIPDSELLQVFCSDKKGESFEKWQKKKLVEMKNTYGEGVEQEPIVWIEVVTFG